MGDDTPAAREHANLALQSYADREERIRRMAVQFGYAHLPPEVHDVARLFAVLVADLLDTLDDGWELFFGLNSLRESRDCMVRQYLADQAAAKEASEAAAKQFAQIMPPSED